MSYITNYGTIVAKIFYLLSSITWRPKSNLQANHYKCSSVRVDDCRIWKRMGKRYAKMLHLGGIILVSKDALVQHVGCIHSEACARKRDQAGRHKRSHLDSPLHPTFSPPLLPWYQQDLNVKSCSGVLPQVSWSWPVCGGSQRLIFKVWQRDKFAQFLYYIFYVMTVIKIMTVI